MTILIFAVSILNLSELCCYEGQWEQHWQVAARRVQQNHQRQHQLRLWEEDGVRLQQQHWLGWQKMRQWVHQKQQQQQQQQQQQDNDIHSDIIDNNMNTNDINDNDSNINQG